MELREGYKLTEVGLIPEDWDVIKLGDITSYTKGYAFKSGDYTKDGVRIIRVSDTLFDKITNKTPVFIDSSRVNEFKKWSLCTNDLILSTVGSKPPMYDSMVGNVVRVTNKHSGSLLNQNAVFLRVKKEYSQVYLYYCFKREKYIEHIEKIYRGNANQASITLVELFKYEIPLPPTLEEQKAIATALSDVDNLITNLDDLTAKKKAIKQGAMQQLLTPPSKGGKRLNGFDGEWVEKSLGDVAEIATGTTPPTRNLDNYGDEFCFVSPADLGNGKYISKTLKNLSVKGFSISRVFPQGSIMVTCIGSTIGKIGIAGKILTSNQQINAVFPNDTFDSEFLYYQLSLITKRIRLMASEQAVPMINKSEFSEIIISLPDLKEQKGITQILSDMDKELEELATKREKYEHIKHGMMQELLTGKIRLV